MEIKDLKFKWAYLFGFFLILALPLLNLPPWFSPPDWGKTIVFRIVLSSLIFVFIWQVLEQKRLSIKTSLPFWLLISLLGIFFLATIFSLDRNFSLWGSPYRSGGFINFAFYIFFAILAFLILKESDWQKIWDFSILIGILVSIIAIFQQLGLVSKIFIPYEARPPSTLGGPIFLAIYLLLLTFLTLGFGLKEKKGGKKFFYFLSFLLFLFVIIFTTQTRAAFIGLAIGFLWFFFFYPKKLILIKIIAAIIFLLGIYGIYYVNTQPRLPKFLEENKLLGGAISRLFSIKQALSDARVSAWKVSWQALKARLILGYGPENFSIGFDKYYDPSPPGIEKMPGAVTSWWDRAHNFIFDISISAGIPALLIYLSLFGVLFWQLQRLKKDSETALISHGIQATSIGYLVANFFSFDTFSSYLISFLLIGYSLSLISEDIPEKPFYFKVKGRSLIIFLLFLALIWFIWSFNIKPLQINTQINSAKYFVESRKCEEAISRMEGIMPKRSFLDAYLRLKYVEFLADCEEKKKMPQLSLEFVKKGYQLMKENIKIQPYYTRNWLLLNGFTNGLLDMFDKEESPEIFKELKKEANYYFEKANELSPKRQEIFIEGIKTDLITGEHQKAKEKAQKCIDLNPRLEDCYWLTGLTNIYLAEDEKAQENINIAGQKGYPIYSENSFLQLAKAYIETKNYQKLIEIYLELIRIRPVEPRYRASLAYLYREVGQFEKAGEEALKLLELVPEDKEKIEEFLRTLPTQELPR